ncbi:hypothetical protein JKL49_11565 [Phenylobacterium sp. 20VBR1]|uniref:Uncharacterized protein n=1 Tax=Phenylobacterium glaciei TaxID=2803784 RepID=A0A941HWF0_9CAUL|nr:hypothetical protein [Phenylobacterium glaciei]MBR7620026.1 hypothetical protein [Phenylobacterium glaciei]
MEQISKIANAGALSARDILDAFDVWLSDRVGEARAAGMDLAFHDSDFDISPGREPALVGWKHMLLAPGACPPKGADWTVYRLQDQGSAANTAKGSLDQDGLRKALEALGYGAYLSSAKAG